MDRVERVKVLKKEGRHEEAIPLLQEWIEETSTDPVGVQPWPYEQLAIIYRKLRALEDEQYILEDFARQRHSPGAMPPKLLARLAQVYDKRGALVRDGNEGEGFPFHREHSVPLDEVPAFRRVGMVLDVETTGLSGRDEIIEFGGIRFGYSVFSGRMLGELERYQGLREPGCEISPAAARAHGLTKQDLRGKDLDHRTVKAMLHSSDLLIAHNASFDRRFVVQMFPVAAQKPWHCSMRACSWTERGYPSAKLDDLLNVSGIKRENSHRALDDAVALLELLNRASNAPGGGTYLKLVMSSPPLRSRSKENQDQSSVVRKRPYEEVQRRSGCLSAAALLVATFGSLFLWL